MPTALRDGSLFHTTGTSFWEVRHQKPLSPAVVLLFFLYFLMTQVFGLVPRVSSTAFSDLNPACVFLPLTGRPFDQVPFSPILCLVPISWSHSVVEQASESAPRCSGFIFPHGLLSAFSYTSSWLPHPSQPPLLASSFAQPANRKLLRAQPQTPSLTQIPLTP